MTLPSTCVQVPGTLSHGWSTEPPSPLLRLPPVNPYIATDFNLRAGEAEMDAERKKVAELAMAMGLPVVLASPPMLTLDEPGRPGSGIRAAAHPPCPMAPSFIVP